MSLRATNVTPLTMSVCSPEGPIFFFKFSKRVRSEAQVKQNSDEELMLKCQLHWPLASYSTPNFKISSEHQIKETLKGNCCLCYKSVTSLFIIIVVFTNHDNLLHFNNGDLSLNIWQPNIEGTHVKLEREHNGER